MHLNFSGTFARCCNFKTNFGLTKFNNFIYTGNLFNFSLVQYLKIKKQIQEEVDIK